MWGLICWTARLIERLFFKVVRVANVIDHSIIADEVILIDAIVEITTKDCGVCFVLITFICDVIEYVVIVVIHGCFIEANTIVRSFIEHSELA